MNTKRMILMITGLLWMACSDTAKVTYDDKIKQGGASLKDGDYAAALISFTEAQTMEIDRWEAYNGIGWSQFKLDQLNLAVSSFAEGSVKIDAGADLYAGWAFVLNAQKDYAGSNTKAQQALDLDVNWVFSFGLGLSASDVHILKAENYFATGFYTESKAEIVILLPSFASVDVTTDSGRADLAKAIEDQKILAKRI